MGKVNVITSEGRVVAVDEKDATKLNQADIRDVVDRGRADINEAESSGFIEGAKAFGEGAADTLTFGGYGAAREGFSGLTDDGGYRDMQIRAQERPYARLAGEAAAILAPTGAFGGTAAAIGEASALGLAGRIGEGAAELGGKWAGRAVEGSLYGIGGHIANTNVTGDPLTIESVVSSAGVGALLGMGMGAVGDLLGGASRKLAGRIAQAEEKAAASNKLAASLEDESIPAYREFRDAHTAAESAAEKLNAEVELDTKAVNKFVEGKGLTSAVKETQSAVDEIRNEISAGRNALMAEARGVYSAGSSGPTGALQSQLTDYNQLTSELKPIQQRLSSISRDISANPHEALNNLRVLHQDLANIGVDTLPELPKLPSLVQPVSGVKLPETLGEFAKMKVPTVERLANGLSPQAAESFGKVTDHLGLARSATPAETVSAVHKALHEFKPEKVGSSLVDKLKQAVGASIGGSVGAGVAGPVGAMVGAMAGRELGRSFNTTIENSFLGAKMTAVRNIRQIVETVGQKAGKGIAELGPVTAVLGQSFPHGTRDPETDVRKQALNRINDIQAMGVVAPDAAYMAVHGLLGRPNDIAAKVANQITTAVDHLVATLPAPSATNTKMGVSDWTPQYHEIQQLAYRLEAVQTPEKAVKRALSGDGNQAGIDTLWNVYPAWMQELGGEVAMSPVMQKATYAEASVYSLVFRQPMSGLQEPSTVMAIQSKYLPPQPSDSKESRPAAPTGRPAAVQSPLAGSSVSGLISQG